MTETGDWNEVLAASWLREPDRIHELHQRTRERLAKLRGREDSTDVVAASVEVLVLRIADFGENQDWFWCIAAICLLGELLFGAQSGQNLKQAAKAAEEPLKNDLEALYHVRDALFHPTIVTGGRKGSLVGKLIDWLRRNDGPDLAEVLHASWAMLAGNAVAIFALRRLNSAGRMLAGAATSS